MKKDKIVELEKRVHKFMDKFQNKYFLNSLEKRERKELINFIINVIENGQRNLL